MDKNEIDDRNAQRFLTFWLAVVASITVCVIVGLLLYYKQAAVLIDLAKVAGGFGGGLFVGQFMIRRGG